MKKARKTIFGANSSDEQIKLAIDDIIINKKSTLSIANKFNIPRTTLRRAMNKYKETLEYPHMGWSSNRLIFTKAQEDLLKDYIIQASKSLMGFGIKQIRILAHDLAKKYELKFPESWTHDGMAGLDWFKGFKNRHPTLALRTPEATSLARARGFNPHSVKIFFDNLKSLMDEYKFEPQDIWNMDETGVTTVQDPGKVIAEKGMKQVGFLTSDERGSLVTIAIAINAIGSSYVTISKNSIQRLVYQRGPIGCIGAGNGSGWMQENEFLIFLTHFCKLTKASKTNKNLLILDNHCSHCSLRSIDFCRDNRIILLTLPPHCSHNIDNWMRNHVGKSFTIYEIPSIIKMELPKATTPKNIQNGFLACGIYPFNPDIFSEDSNLISNDDDMSELSNIPRAGKLAYCDPENDTINSTLSPMPMTSDNEL
ncbi:uncharacterized protein LOC135925845 [Gordionus sp. m RMFG-2023]|uniref:uncharacterized protein LOC135925845 n=1 Tax=Gordionus sp. m RMFG-2023 TaxID=3053472 RepID=UPI0031FD1ADA